MKNYDVIDGICGDFTDKARVCFDKGYKQGYEDGIGDGAKSVKSWDKACYEQGLNNAWEAARKIDTNRNIEEAVFGEDLTHGFMHISASEAIAKIKEYEDSQKCKTCKYYGHALDEKVGTNVCYGCVNNELYKEKQTDDEIRVGDEIVLKKDIDYRPIVITKIKDDNELFGVNRDGGLYGWIRKDEAKKTGRHFNQIEEILKQMQEDKG